MTHYILNQGFSLCWRRLVSLPNQQLKNRKRKNVRLYFNVESGPLLPWTREMPETPWTVVVFANSESFHLEILYHRDKVKSRTAIDPPSPSTWPRTATLMIPPWWTLFLSTSNLTDHDQFSPGNEASQSPDLICRHVWCLWPLGEIMCCTCFCNWFIKNHMKCPCANRP